jgi:hypothetical protein
LGGVTTYQIGRGPIVNFNSRVHSTHKAACCQRGQRSCADRQSLFSRIRHSRPQKERHPSMPCLPHTRGCLTSSTTFSHRPALQRWQTCRTPSPNTTTATTSTRSRRHTSCRAPRRSSPMCVYPRTWGRPRLLTSRVGFGHPPRFVEPAHRAPDVRRVCGPRARLRVLPAEAWLLARRHPRPQHSSLSRVAIWDRSRRRCEHR